MFQCWNPPKTLSETHLQAWIAKKKIIKKSSFKYWVVGENMRYVTSTTHAYLSWLKKCLNTREWEDSKDRATESCQNFADTGDWIKST